MPSLETPTGFQVRQNERLAPLTTFKIGGPARFLAFLESLDGLREALTFRKANNLDLFVLGGGSNVLISDNGFDGLVMHLVHRGISIVSENAHAVTLSIQAAETWDDVVRFAVERQWWGIENLSHIPGQAGAALIQNIGAYGAQISDVFESVEVMEIETGETRTLKHEACRLGYRKSIFNSTGKGRFVILNLALRLLKQGRPNLKYPDVKTCFDQRGVTEPTLPEIRHAIIAIRDRKFPFPREEKGGNAGSFFKNLFLTEAEYQRLERHFEKHLSSDDVSRLRALRSKFPTAGSIKIPTAFLMEVCNLKSCRIGGAQVNETQPLVLLNQGGATARDVLGLARHIRQTIYAKTGLTIEVEPELVGFSRDELAEYLSLPD